jgi:hypothetical protein
MSHLVILQLQHPEAGLQQYSIGFGPDDNESGWRSPYFGWSPSGEIVYASGTVVRLTGGRTCSLPARSTFISNDRAVTRNQPSHGPLSIFTFYDAGCNDQEKWDAPHDWSIVAAAPDRGLLSIEERTERGVENFIFDALRKEVLRHGSGEDAPHGEFADSGRALCSGGDVVKAERVPATCWDVETGNKIGQTPKANAGFALATAAHAKRVVVSDYKRMKVPFDHEYGATFQGRVVWDFGSGKELVAWRPESQSYADPFLTLPKPVTGPFRVAISADGEYIAEGGNGIIRLYKIEP